jgi:hypothetical protein
VIGSYFSFVSKKKQASMGKPSSAMYTCKDCGRYVFPDEDHNCEDDDGPVKPPPSASELENERKKAEEEKKKQEA